MCGISKLVMKVVAIVTSEWKKMFKKCTRLKMTDNKIYIDQDLIELKFNDGEVISIYKRLPATCTCGKITTENKCKHFKVVKKMFHIVDEGVQTIKNHIQSGKSRNTIIPEEQPFIKKDMYECECLVCFLPFAQDTKSVDCMTCRQKVHKTCWKEWEESPLRKGSSQKECMYCNNMFENRLVDNTGCVL